MLNFWTAQYRYAGPYRLDITVKGQDPVGRIFAPTWDMVMQHKATKDDNSYIQEYHKMMVTSYQQNRLVWETILNKDYLVLVCFCPADAFCHRHLLRHYLVELGAVYNGELTSQQKPILK